MNMLTMKEIRARLNRKYRDAWNAEVAHYHGKKAAIAKVRRMMNTLHADDGLKLALDTYEIRIDDEMQTDMGG